MLEDVLDKEFEGGWPTAERHGVAAKNVLVTLAAKNVPASGERQTRLNRCLEVATTFLKLGEVESASKAFHGRPQTLTARN